MKTRNLHLTGWILFLVSAVFFIITSGTILELTASITFLAGCLVFLISLLFYGQ
ncbi:MAG: cytochrome oxidase subunit III [Spirochaetia bacterium]|nr:cytochrome oxidase subunit III [Spirochaetia bacterium]